MTTPSAVSKVSKFAVPFLGVLGAIQGSDPNIASTAFVGASRGLDMTGEVASLAASISTLALSATVISTGLLADRLGRRRVLMVALVVAIIGDLIVALSPTATIFLLGRAIAGIGLGAVFGAGFAYIRAVTAPNKIPAAMGVFGASVGATTVLLSFFGGAISSVEWRLAFLVIPITCALALIGTRVLLPIEPPQPGGKQDLLGQVLLAAGVIGLLTGFAHIGKGLVHPLSGGAFVIGLAALAAWTLVERHRDNRFFPVEVFRSPLFLAAICAGFVYNFGMAVAFLQLANLWQYVVHLTTLKVSLWQLPFMLIGIVAALVFGRLMAKGMKNGTALLAGSIMSAAGFGFLFIARSADGLLLFLPGTLLIGIGVIVASLPYGNLIIGQAPKKYFGPVTSSRTTLGQFFYAAGLSLATVAIDKMTTGGTLSRLRDAGVQPQQLATGLDAVTTYAANGSQPSTPLGQQALHGAYPSYEAAFGKVMLATGAISLIVGVIGWALLRAHEDEPVVEPAAA